MPLRAFLNEVEIVSIDLSNEKWDEIKKKLGTKEITIKLACCSQDGFLRKSVLGLKHFVHSKSGELCDWKPESPEHLKSKIHIIEACRQNNWEAIPEFSEGPWRADVLAVKGKNRIAFEVQWSKQSFEQTIIRQNRYKESKVRGCWFFRSAPKELKTHNRLKANAEIPAFKIDKNEAGEILVEFHDSKIPLIQFVDNLLNKRLKYCSQIRLKPVQKIAILFFEISCWKCRRNQHCYTVNKNLLTICNNEVNFLEQNGSELDKDPQIVDAVNQILKSEQGRNLRVGLVKNRFSKTVGGSYASHGCYYCDSIFGDYHLITAKMDAHNYSSTCSFEVDFNLGEITESYKHWCFSESGEFCE